MNYHHTAGNSMYMPNTRPPVPGYAPYSGKPPGVPQVSSAQVPYSQMYFVQPGSAPYVSPACFQPGTEVKYSGGGRGVPEAAGVVGVMTPSGMVYGQHMAAPPGAMILQGGQQMIPVSHPPMFQQSSGHQPRMRYGPSVQPPVTQYNMGGGAGSMPQQPQQQQQQFFKGAYVGNQPPPQQPSASSAPKREKRILQIVNPDTGKEVNITADQGFASTANDADNSVHVTTEQNIAAQFAAQVAATLNTSSASSSLQKAVVASLVTEDNAGSHLSAAAAAFTTSSDAKTLPSEVTTSEETVPIPSAEMDSKNVAQLTAISASSTVPDQAEAAPVHVSEEEVNTSSVLTPASGVVPETDETKAPDVASTQQPLQTVLPSKASNGPLLEPSLTADDDVAKSKTTAKSSAKTLQGVKDIPQQQPVQQCLESKASSATASIIVATSESSVPLSAAVSDNGNKKKNRKKGKDLNTKGKVLQGSDMDAFIDDGSQADDQGGNAVDSDPPAVSNAEVTKADAAPAASAVAAAPPLASDGAVDGTDGCPPAEQLSNDALQNSTSVSAAEVDRIVQSTTRSDVEVLHEPTVAKSSDDGLNSVPSEIAVDADCLRVRDESLASLADSSAKINITKASSVDGSGVDDAVVPEKCNTVEPVCDVKTFQGPSTDQEVRNATGLVESVANDREVEDTESGSSTEVEAHAPVKLNKVDLKYTYSEDQWSPLNPEGKKQYDRNFMLQLQFADPSIVKPTGLPQLPDIILNEPRVKTDFARQSSVDPMSPIDFTPGFIKQSMGTGGGGGGGGGRGPLRRGGGGSGMKRGVGGGGGGGEQQRKVINVSLEHNIALHTTENAWKPTLLKPKEGELATEELYKKIRGILNKLTPQKFHTLIQQVQHLPIDTEQRLSGCINIIFEKAISEPNFSVAYANMARCLIAISVPLDADPSQVVGFRKLLLNKCQQEFEKDKLEELDIENLQCQIAEASSEEKRKQLIEKRNETMYRAKRRSLGNIRFIGELFKLKMLTEKIMHECLTKLLRSYEDEDSLECLCQLLTTIGQDIDKKPPGMTIMNKYFTELQDMVDKKKTSSRIRFMIQDVIELRKNKWVPRRENNNPKTIEQIHKEAEQEEQEKQLALQKFTQDQRSRRGPPPTGRLGPPSAPNPHGVDDGWTAVGRAPKSIVDPARMKLNKQPMDENIQLGPGGKGMSAWHRGSSGGGKTLSQENERPTSTPNRFSALGGFGSESMDARSRPGGRVGSGYAGRLSGPQSRAPTSRQSQERPPHEVSFRAPGSIGRNVGAMSPAGSRSSSQEIRTGRDVKVQAAEPGTAADRTGASRNEEREISEAEIEKKTKSLMDEYLHGHDIKEAALCVKELGSSKSLQLFVYHSLLQNLERSSQARLYTGTLHLHLVKTKQMPIGHYVEGLRSVLELADDMTIDIPRIWEYLGELISPVVGDGTVTLSFLRDACGPLFGCGKAGLVVANVLHGKVHSLGHHKVAELWHESGLKWTDFLKADAVQSFIEEQKLQFTEEHRSSEAQSSGHLSVEKVQEHLAKLLNDSSTDVENLIDWIDDSVDGQMAHSASFIRAFTSSLCSSCLMKQRNTMAVDQEKFRKYLSVLSKYIDHNVALEVQALFALQALVNKLEHPPGLLRAFFDTLYDDEVISEEAFYTWRNSSEPSEAAGKGVALSSVVQFFHWLENEEDS